MHSPLFKNLETFKDKIRQWHILYFLRWVLTFVPSQDIEQRSWGRKEAIWLLEFHFAPVQGSKPLIKGQRLTVLGFVAHVVWVTTTDLCSYSSADNTESDGFRGPPIKLYQQKQAADRFCLVHCNLPPLALQCQRLIRTENSRYKVALVQTVRLFLAGIKKLKEHQGKTPWLNPYF